jgi:uncharacterized tellurite resistance protein B-like protein
MSLFGFLRPSPQVQLAKSHVKNLVEMAQADGYFDKIEHIFLLQIASKYDLTEKQTELLVKEVNKIQFQKPETTQKAFSQLYDLVRMMLIDGIVHIQEMNVCENLAEKLGFQDAKNLVNSLIKNVEGGKSEQEAYLMLN